MVQLHHQNYCFCGFPLQSKELPLRVLASPARNLAPILRQGDRHDAQTRERHDCYGYRCHCDPHVRYRRGCAVVLEGDSGAAETPRPAARLSSRLDSSSWLACPKRQRRLGLTHRCESARVWFFVQVLMKSRRFAKTEEKCADLQLTAQGPPDELPALCAF